MLHQYLTSLMQCVAMRKFPSFESIHDSIVSQARPTCAKRERSSELHIQVMSSVAQYDAVQSSIILSHDILHQCLSSNNEWWPSCRHLFCYMSCKNTLTNPNTSRFVEVDLVCETNMIPSSNF